ncbi:patatin-like phospholipase family protein [Gelidibacter sp.]|uniref:patatin-like phospholipase family protein n=1 Tax=Gelidibacter sp. TaxID=2018083 RepID=UPI002CF96591|nr:patatin-like phospholipase family protein [Gelidibacter sp.]HUH29450.1 patatin-like phospholipase family protein [Gelidibacter sp.]
MNGQDTVSQIPQKTPKIGLVLSGGGAKGFAHIGVLKVIDSLDIKIDYIAGTSMGAIIGSLYASGYSGKQLDSIFRSLNFDDVISDNLPRSAKTFYERDNSERYAVTLPFTNFKLKLPSALSRGQNVFNLLSKLTLHVTDISDFDQLPIPFFCVATDVETGKAIILDQGNLAQAVTASGAFPSLFQPVIIDDRVLIDGGVINNYPIDELKVKGMDVIIGVDVQDGLAKREDLNSAPAILLQINNYRTISDMIKKVEKTDIYIKPDITDYTVVSFSEGKKIIESGARAALIKLDELKKLPKYKSSRGVEMDLTSKDSIAINKVKIHGNNRYTRAYILGKLKLVEDTKVSYANFNEGVNNLVATNNFTTFYYEFEKTDRPNVFNLLATVDESNVTNFLKFGLHYDDLYKSAALVNFTKKRALLDDDVVSLDLILGDQVRYNFEYYIDKGFYWSIGLRSRFNQFNRNVNVKLFLNDQEQSLTGLNKIGVEIEDQTNQIYIQTMFGKDFALSLGGEHKRLKIKSETVAVSGPRGQRFFENTDYLSVFGTLRLDMYDNKYYPKTGFYFNGDFHLYLHASHFNEDFNKFSIAKADIGYAFGITDKLSANIFTQGGFKIGDTNTQSLDFALGGYGNNFINNFISFYGYDYITLTGDSFVKGTMSFDYELFKKHHITFAANYANIGYGLFKSGTWFSSPTYSGYALGYGLETFLGPLEAKYTYSPELGESIWLFNLGFWF